MEREHVQTPDVNRDHEPVDGDRVRHSVRAVPRPFFGQRRARSDAPHLAIRGQIVAEWPRDPTPFAVQATAS